MENTIGEVLDKKSNNDVVNISISSVFFWSVIYWFLYLFVRASFNFILNPYRFNIGDSYYMPGVYFVTIIFFIVFPLYYLIKLYLKNNEENKRQRINKYIIGLLFIMFMHGTYSYVNVTLGSKFMCRQSAGAVPYLRTFYNSYCNQESPSKFQAVLLYFMGIGGNGTETIYGYWSPSYREAQIFSSKTFPLAKKWLVSNSVGVPIRCRYNLSQRYYPEQTVVNGNFVKGLQVTEKKFLIYDISVEIPFTEDRIKNSCESVFESSGVKGNSMFRYYISSEKGGRDSFEKLYPDEDIKEVLKSDLEFLGIVSYYSDGRDQFIDFLLKN